MRARAPVSCTRTGCAAARAIGRRRRIPVRHLAELAGRLGADSIPGSGTRSGPRTGPRSGTGARTRACTGPRAEVGRNRLRNEVGLTLAGRFELDRGARAERACRRLGRPAGRPRTRGCPCGRVERPEVHLPASMRNYFAGHDVSWEAFLSLHSAVARQLQLAKVNYGEGFYTKQGLARWLAGHGQHYAAWAKTHPGAAAALAKQPSNTATSDRLAVRANTKVRDPRTLRVLAHAFPGAGQDRRSRRVDARRCGRRRRERGRTARQHRQAAELERAEAAQGVADGGLPRRRTDDPRQREAGTGTAHAPFEVDPSPRAVGPALACSAAQGDVRHPVARRVHQPRPEAAGRFGGAKTTPTLQLSPGPSAAISPAQVSPRSAKLAGPARRSRRGRGARERSSCS